MIYRAQFILPIGRPPIPDGGIAVSDGKIQKVAPFAEFGGLSADEYIDLRPLVLMPGLINCHTHLEEGVLRSKVEECSSFTGWYARTAKYLAGSDIAKRINAVRLGCRESLFYGVTTVADTASTGASFLVLREEKIRSLVFLHFKGLIPWQAQTEFELVRSRIHLLEGVFPMEQIGFSPEAPYSASLELYRHAIKESKNCNALFQTHLAESGEEFEMFSSHTGPLYEFSQRIHAQDLHDHTRGPLPFLVKNNLAPMRSLVLHGNYLTSEDLEILARRRISLVHCAQSHSYFGHRDFPFQSALDSGVNICLGTESLASSATLNLFDDMYMIKRKNPNLEAARILRSATVNGAKALGLENRIGVLEPGMEADVIGLHLSGVLREETLYDEIVQGDPQVEFVMIAGEQLIA